uniref:ATP-binding cassette sub-family G member 2-like n=1 Tax=Callorhinchus milii TaxID=7868 RepID=V9K934_CALMI|eukprot:gi/632936635/ref/XP_007895567.1/ PREDICTED: ATP-binding cassette sub-family G member 2-like [Callorhinchus milii]
MGTENSKKDLAEIPNHQFPHSSSLSPGHSSLSVEPGDEDASFQRSVPTRESLRCPQGSVVSFHNIEYFITSSSRLPCKRKVIKKQILFGVNGILKPGLNAILGPTGSGKSSLLDILAARKDPAGLSGEVLIDGRDQPSNFKCISGYVVQDDVVMGTLTVKENLLFSAALRLPNSISFKEKEERVDQVISELGLTKVANSKVGTEMVRGVSGGERKRTNIGMELITEPPVLFLDEPTTGLDSSTANAVLILLKRLSRRGRTIIFSIHQPRYSIFKLFDSLSLLASGRMVYHGPAKLALQYFSSIGYECEAFNNPADFFLDIINKDSTAVTTNEKCASDLNHESSVVERKYSADDDVEQVTPMAEQLSELYLKSNHWQDVGETLKKIEASRDDKKSNKKKGQSITYVTSFFHQLLWVSRRSFKNLVRSPEASFAQLAVIAVLGLIVGAIFFGVTLDPSGIQNRIGALFFLTTNQCFTSVSAVELFIRNKKLFVHEYTSGYYRISAYFLALLIGDLLPMRTLPGILFSCITYWLIGYKPVVGNFFFFMLCLITVSYAATSMSLAISAGMDLVSIANLICTICFVFMIIFSGLLVNLPSVVGWLSWLKYFSISRYGFTALQVNEFRGLYFCDGQNISTSLPDALANCSSSSKFGGVCYGEEYLCSQGIGIDDWAMWENIVALLCMTIIFLTITYMKLRFMRKYT